MRRSGEGVFDLTPSLLQERESTCFQVENIDQKCCEGFASDFSALSIYVRPDRTPNINSIELD